MMQHEMLRAVDEEHVLRKIIDMRLQHDIERDDAQRETHAAPDGRMIGARQSHQPARHQTQNVQMEQETRRAPTAASFAENLCAVRSYENMNGIVLKQVRRMRLGP